MLRVLKGLFPGSKSSSSERPPTPVAPEPETRLCISCKSRPQGRSWSTGQYYPWCSNTCAAPGVFPGLQPSPNIKGVTGKSTSTRSISAPALSLCIHCKKKPRYNDGVVVHPYCGRTCANLAKSRVSTNRNVRVPTNPPNTTTPTSITNLPGTVVSTNTGSGPGPAKEISPGPVPTYPRNSGVLANNRSSVYRTTPSALACQIPGCSSPGYVDQNGVATNYCTRTHRDWGKRGCISCRAASRNGTSVFCGICHNEAILMAPVIVQVPKDHENYRSVELQFQQSWRHKSRCPQVRAIYKIVITMTSKAGYDQYRDEVEAEGNFSSTGQSPGNEKRRWHGTTRKCNIGDNEETELCLDPSCSLCCIIRVSFDLSFFAKKTNWGRFGAGIYTSSIASKSDGYSRNGCNSRWKALLLNKVVVGRGYKTTVDNSALTEPPAGYDSVLAEVGPRLNYDELVVYDNDAIRPSYLVMYDTP